MDAYVTKPVTLDALGQVLGGLIRSQAGDARSAVLDQQTVDGLRELGGTPSVLEQVVGVFVESAPAEIAALRDAATMADRCEVARAAHRFKAAARRWAPRPWVPS